MDIKEKQAIWLKEKPLFEAELIYSHLLPFFHFNENTGDYEIKTESVNNTDEEDRKVAYESLNTGWAMWLRAKRTAKAQVPEGFVLMSKSDLESWHLWDGDSENMYRDNYSESICDDVELGAVFEIDVKMAFKVPPIYVVPIYSDSDDYEYEEFESEELAQKAAAENKAMIEAQEQGQ